MAVEEPAVLARAVRFSKDFRAFLRAAVGLELDNPLLMQTIKAAASVFVEGGS